MDNVLIKFELGNQPCIDTTRFPNPDNSSALHLQICTTEELIYLLPESSSL